MAARAEVENAGDRKQVRDAGRRVKRREQRFYDALRQVMSTPAGRLVFGERTHGFLARAGVFRSVMADRPEWIFHNAGRQDFGHLMMAELVRASESSYELMQKEMRSLADRDATETHAAHQQRAEETKNNG